MIVLCACSDSVKAKMDAGAMDAGDPFDQGKELKVAVNGPTFVRLDPLSIVTPADPKTSMEWDLQFNGWDVFTNSGVSGGGQCQSFGPLDLSAFFETTAPEVPFLYQDITGGAFYRWYAYEGAPNHTLWSRNHTYGIVDGTRMFKLQVVGYYGMQMGAPVTAIYSIRYAEVTSTGVMPTQTLTDIDGTAGGPTGTDATQSECVDLGTGMKVKLNVAESKASMAWHICFRRDKISVNGELGGPRNIGALDFDAEKTPTETVEMVKAEPQMSRDMRFDAVNASTFQGKMFRGDRVISAYTDLWIDRTKNPITPRSAAFLSYAADGKRPFVIGFPKFEGASAQGPGTVVMRVKGVK